MKVRTSLFLLSAIFVIIIAALGYVMLNTSNLVNNEVRESESATQIFKDIFELNIVTYEYLTFHEERMHQQWLIKYVSLGKLLEGMISEEIHAEHLLIMKSIISDYESLGDFFSLLQANFTERERLIDENKPQAEIDLSLASEKRLSSQALISSQRMASEVIKFSALMEQRIVQVQQRTNSIALLSIIGFIVLSFSISFFTTRAIVGPLNELIKSAEIIGKGDLKHRVGIETRNEIGELAVAFNQMTEKRQQVEERIIHLNRVLRAIRNVNQLITQERDLDRLLESACEQLTETASYATAWILLNDDEGTPTKFVRRELSGHTMSLSDLPEQGEFMACTQAILAQAGVQIINRGADVCQDCFLLARRNEHYDVMAIRLEYEGKIYGVMNVCVPSEFALDSEERSLFAELAGDISFALFSIGIEEERKQAEKKLAKRTYDLGERVKELDLLHTIHDIASDWEASLKDILKRTVDIMPSGWQYPEMACARIKVEENEYSTDNFEETPWNQTSEIIVRGDRTGTVEVGYLEEKPQEDGSSFLEEEYALLATISRQLGRTIERIKAEDEVKEHSEHLEVMIEKRTQDLRDAQDELVRKEKLAALGQLGGGVAHELRNPLGVISNAVYFLKSSLTNADDTTVEYLDMMSSEIRVAVQIIENLLSLTRRSEPTIVETPVAELVARSLVRQAPPDGVDVTTEISDEALSVLADPSQIVQVMENLLSNGYQAMSDGGELAIKAWEENNNVLISVADTGCGIPEEQFEEIFEPLFTTKARGFGFGLSTSRDLISANNGSIEVGSEIGVGSTFTLRLPGTS